MSAWMNLGTLTSTMAWAAEVRGALGFNKHFEFKMAHGSEVRGGGGGGEWMR